MAEIHVREGESQVAAVVGDLVVVHLVEPGATGHQWTAEVAGGAVAEESSTVTFPSEATSSEAISAPGRAGERAVGLRAVTRGSADVTLSLARAWEDVVPVERVHLHVEVTDA